MHQLMSGELYGASPVEAFYWVLKNKPSAELQPMQEGKVTQNDEDALGRTFLQARLISEAMFTEDITDTSCGRCRTPFEVFRTCLSQAAFKGDALEDVHDKVILSYINWKFAQHKIHAFPINMTYGRNVDHQTSCRTPNISECHTLELAQLTIECLDTMAKNKGKSFEDLTQGLSKQECLQRAMMDAAFAQSIQSAMWTPSATDGRKRKIVTLYNKLDTHELEMNALFDGSSALWVSKFFSGVFTWKRARAASSGFSFFSTPCPSDEIDTTPTCDDPVSLGKRI